MKTKIIITLSLFATLHCQQILAQVDSVKTTTTITTTTTTGSTTTGNTTDNNDESDPKKKNGDYSRFYIGARFMPTITKFDVNTLENGSAKTSFVIGYGIGGLIGVNLSKNIGIQAEVIYSSLSQKFTDKNAERQIDLTYIHIPLLFIFNTDISKPVNFNITAGPQIGINTGSSINTDGTSGSDTVTAVIAVKPADFGIAYGAGLDFRLSSSLSLDIGFRGVLGILDISDKNKTTTSDQYYLLDRSHVETYAGYAGLKLLF